MSTSIDNAPAGNSFTRLLAALDEHGYSCRRLTTTTAVATCPACGRPDALRVWYIAAEQRTDLRCMGTCA